MLQHNRLWCCPSRQVLRKRQAHLNAARVVRVLRDEENAQSQVRKELLTDRQVTLSQHWYEPHLPGTDAQRDLTRSEQAYRQEALQASGLVGSGDQLHLPYSQPQFHAEHTIEVKSREAMLCIIFEGSGISLLVNVQACYCILFSSKIQPHISLL